MKKVTLFLTAALAATAFAQDTKVGAITVAHPWARVTPGAVKTSAAFMMLDNKGAADKLVSVSGDIAEAIQIHTMITDGTVMKMREIESIDIPANGKAELKPGGFHVMLIGLKDGLKEGAKFPLKLKFEKAGEVTVQVTVEKPPVPGQADHKH